ncbi:MAG: biotin/lipoyl-containing protein, partial [Planctomycetota bacterium]
MTIEITIPSPGESISEVVLGPWHKRSGDWVDKDETLVEIESDKVTLEVPSPESGVLKVLAEEGAEMQVGDVIANIDPSAARPEGAAAADAAARSASAEGDGTATATAAPPSAPEHAGAPAVDNGHRATSLARKIAADKGVDLSTVQGSGPSGRIRKSDVLAASGTAPGISTPR